MIFHLLFKACYHVEVFNVCDEILIVNLEFFHHTAFTIWTNGSSAVFCDSVFVSLTLNSFETKYFIRPDMLYILSLVMYEGFMGFK